MSRQPSQPTAPGRLRGLLMLAFSGVAYLSFVASFGVVWFGFLADFHALPVTVDRRPGATMGPVGAVFFDLALVLLFGLQHSVMARRGFKEWWTRWIPPSLERSVYVLFSSVALAILMALWQPISGVVWHVEWPAARIVLYTLFLGAMPLSVLASFQIDHFELLGLRQAWAGAKGRGLPSPPRFVQPLLYRIVRHPIQLASLVMLWAAPTLTWGHLLLSSSMSIYIGIGLFFEERDLIAKIGRGYLEYRRRVPAVIPRLRVLRWVLGWSIVALLAGAALTRAASRPERSAHSTRGALSFETVLHEGRVRSFALYRPEHALPDSDLVVVLHGTGGGIDRIRAFTGRAFEHLADRHGFSVVYPEGYEGAWNGCRRSSPYAANRLGIDDAGFLNLVVDEIRRDLGAGAGATYLFGFSGGGHLALRAALEAPGSFRGVAVVAASLPLPEVSKCSAPVSLEVPVVLLAGTEDPISPFEGGMVLAPAPGAAKPLGEVLAARESARRLAEWAGHVDPPRHIRMPEVDGDPSTRVVISEWSHPGRVRVQLVTVVGGGHTIPRPGVRFPDVAGRQTEEIDTAALVWDFWTSADPDPR